MTKQELIEIRETLAQDLKGVLDSETLLKAHGAQVMVTYKMLRDNIRDIDYVLDSEFLMYILGIE